MSSTVDFSGFFNRSFQQVANAFNRSGSWIRKKAIKLRNLRKTDVNTTKSKHAPLVFFFYIHTYACYI